MIDRIKQIMDYYELGASSFADQLGINRSNLTHLFSGRNQPSLELVKKILHCFPDIKTEWLIMGVGDMFRNEVEKKLISKVQSTNKLDVEDKEPNLFSTMPIQPKSASKTALEKDVTEGNTIRNQIFDSQRDIERQIFEPSVNPTIEKKLPLPSQANIEVSKIVFFYSNGEYEMFTPKT